MTENAWLVLGASVLAVVNVVLDSMAEERRRQHFLMTGYWR